MDFIYSKSKILSKELCEQFINQFENSKDSHQNDSNGAHKTSTDIVFNQEHYQLPEWNELIDEMLISLNEGLSEYIEKFEVLNHMNEFQLTTFNMQKYNSGEGFYGWHCERNGQKEFINRMLVWMIYLNDVEDGGTEFLYQNHKVDAEQGKLLIWPAEWTHTHRGIISNNQTKYILTGWYGYTL
jgi:hypothetical protein